MKHLTIALLTSLFISCNQDNKSVDKLSVSDDRSPLEQDSSLIHSTDSLIGDWGVFATTSNGTQTNCNVCPRITFEKDGTATLDIPSGDKAKLRWKAEGLKLTIANIDSEVVQTTFLDSDYLMTFERKNKFLELELKQPDKNYSEILRR